MADYASASVFSLYTLMFLFAAGAFALLFWAVKSGAVTSDEAPKYRMMEDDLPRPSSVALLEGGSHGDAQR